jgi:D-alanine-D-alanine ligase
MSQYRIAVLRGGPSEEHDVSLRTGAALLEALPKDRVIPVDVVITRAGEWLHDGRRLMPERILDMVDGVIIGLHGAYGEDGKVQRLLERRGVPFAGSGSYASAIAMHKAITKDHLRDSDIKLAPHMLVSHMSRGQTTEIARGLSALFGPEYVIKPVQSGSSHGVRIVENPSKLAQALEEALSVYEQVIVEKRIRGKEATCGVIENFRGESLYALPPIEIVPAGSQQFFDYEAKYNGASEEICPGRFSASEKEELMRLARFVHEELGLRHYSRSDFILAEDGVYFLEANTLPGLTQASLVPLALRSVGSSLEDFASHLVDTITV